MNRRDFNKLASGLATNFALGGLLEGCATAPTSASSNYGSTARKGRVVMTLTSFTGGRGCTVRVFDWDTRATTDYDVPLQIVHSITSDPLDADVIYLFEVFGSAAKVNLRTGSVVKIDHKLGRGIFNGHGSLTKDRDLLVCTEIEAGAPTTRIRSTRDLSIVAELPKECGACHQATVLPNSTLIGMGNTRGRESVITFYDYAAKKITKRVPVPNHAFHVMPLSSSEVIGTCVNSSLMTQVDRFKAVKKEMDAFDNLTMFNANARVVSSPLVYVRTDGFARNLYDERRSEDFVMNFGLARAPGERLFSTHVRSNKVLLWKGFEIERSLDALEPQHVKTSLDGSEFMVIAAGKVCIYSFETFQLIERFEKWPAVTAISSYNA